jgi:DNA helicase-2/ATP-dependent DNA helicase PcrA
MDNEDAGKEITVVRTQRFFYVTCSRAERSFAVVYYAAEPAQARAAMISQAWFDAEEIELIA